MTNGISLIEFEGLQEFWEQEPPRKEDNQSESNYDYSHFDMCLALERSYEPDAYLCWQGTRFPQWM